MTTSVDCVEILNVYANSLVISSLRIVNRTYLETEKFVSNPVDTPSEAELAASQLPVRQSATESRSNVAPEHVREHADPATRSNMECDAGVLLPYHHYSETMF